MSPHPYIPSTLHLPDFIPNTFGLELLVGGFGFIIILVISITWNLSGRWRPDFSAVTKAKMCWFLCSGLIHLVLEGYFAGFHRTFSGSDNFLAQIWKEYSKGDSRYISSDAFTVLMETFTAVVDGPLCLLTVYAYIKEKPYVHVLQILVSAAQFYGDLLYMGVEWMEGFAHGPPFHPVYFWGYFVFMNSFWLIIPALLIMDSSRSITAAFSAVKRNYSAEMKTPNSDSHRKIKFNLKEK